MRPAEHTIEAIIQAGQALQATGRNVTGFSLRNKVGGGNSRRLKQVWDEYQTERPMTNKESAAELPVELSEEVVTMTRVMTEHIALLAAVLNEKAIKAAEIRVEAVTHGADELRELTNRELSDAAHTVDALESRLGEMKEDAEGLRSRLIEAQASIQAQAIELAQLRERLAAAEKAEKVSGEQHATELAQINLLREMERTHLQQEIVLVRGEINEQRKLSQAAVAAREEAAQMRGQMEGLRARIADLMQIIDDLQSSGSKSPKSSSKTPKEAQENEAQAKLI